MTPGDTVHIVKTHKRRAWYEGAGMIVNVRHQWLENSELVVDAEVRFSDGCVERTRAYAARQVDPKGWISKFNARRRTRAASQAA